MGRRSQSRSRAPPAAVLTTRLRSWVSSPARVVEDGYELRFVSATGESRWELGPEALGRTFSAIAVAPDTRVDERGMRWELTDKPMDLLGDLGVSNVVTSADAAIVCRSGAVAAYLLSAADPHR